jgi:hypothetical protein
MASELGTAVPLSQLLPQLQTVLDQLTGIQGLLEGGLGKDLPISDLLPQVGRPAAATGRLLLLLLPLGPRPSLSPGAGLGRCRSAGCCQPALPAGICRHPGRWEQHACLCSGSAPATKPTERLTLTAPLSPCTSLQVKALLGQLGGIQSLLGGDSLLGKQIPITGLLPQLRSLLGELTSLQGLLEGGLGRDLPIGGLDEALKPLLGQLTGLQSLLGGKSLLGKPVPITGLLPQVRSEPSSARAPTLALCVLHCCLAVSCTKPPSAHRSASRFINCTHLPLPLLR